MLAERGTPIELPVPAEGRKPIRVGPWVRIILVLVVETIVVGLVLAWLLATAPNIGVPGPYRAYRLVWGQEFSGPAGAAPDPRVWRVASGGGVWGNDDLEYYTSRASNVSLDGAGHLAITARAGGFADRRGVRWPYTSGRLQTYGRFQFKYGRIEARIKLPAGQGFWPAFWALGTNCHRVGWPACGEVDIMENIGSEPHGVIGALHGPEAGVHSGYEDIVSAHLASDVDSRFHVFGIDWGPGQFIFSVDGRPYATVTPGSLPRRGRWVFDQPFFLLLNLAVGGTYPGPPNAATRFPATMLVDWVRAYSGTG